MRTRVAPAMRTRVAPAMRKRLAGILIVAAGALGGCGFDVQSGDLFQITRTGAGQKLTMVVSYDGTLSCNNGPQKQLPDPLLLQGRDLSTSLNNDVNKHLNLRATRSSVFSYTVKLQNGTISFPDTAALEHPDLAQTEQFFVNAAQQGCGISGQ
jgi:hypothetical protein